MKHFFSLWLFILFFVGAQAQTAETYLKEIAKNQQLDIQWQERKTSLASEGIRSFVGYYQDNFVATLSVGGQSVSGSFHYRDTSYEINEQKDNWSFRLIKISDVALPIRLIRTQAVRQHVLQY